MKRTKTILFSFFLLTFILMECSMKVDARDYDITVVPLSRNGISLYLSRISKGEAKKDMLMIHGLTYSSHEFDVDYEDYSLSRYFADRGYAVWLLDIAGYGRSEKPENGLVVNSDYAAEDIAAAISKIQETDGVSKIDLFGWSWGTVTTTRYAKKHPENINKLVLYAPIMTGLGCYEVSGSYHLNDWCNAADDFQKTDEGEIDYTIMEPGAAATYLSDCWRYDGGFSPCGGRIDLFVDGPLIRLDGINVPVLIIYGDNDGYMDLELLDALEMPDGSKKIKVSGASHVMYIEKPYYKIFRENVYGFLTDSENGMKISMTDFSR